MQAAVCTAALAPSWDVEGKRDSRKEWIGDLKLL